MTHRTVAFGARVPTAKGTTQLLWWPPGGSPLNHGPRDSGNKSPDRARSFNRRARFGGECAQWLTQCMTVWPRWQQGLGAVWLDETNWQLTRLLCRASPRWQMQIIERQLANGPMSQLPIDWQASATRAHSRITDLCSWLPDEQLAESSCLSYRTESPLLAWTKLSGMVAFGSMELEFWGTSRNTVLGTNGKLD